MKALVFILGGLLFIAASLFGRRVEKGFLANCTDVSGTVVDLKEETQRSGNSTRKVVLPIIEYRTDVTLRFKAEVDARKHNLAPGKTVQVLISRSNPKVAKVQSRFKESFLLLNLLFVMGLGATVIGIANLDPSDFSLSFLNEPFYLIAAVVAVAFACIRLGPTVRYLMRYGAQHRENAWEVEHTSEPPES
ncbi:DUF3592 domain-containing protein [Ferrimonas balearica]|uniref:DUF3592 domain-containing protein n=1 Tax=Ferrimonas balearica TaxID=44012 RepID=UPI001C994534|nr:DUF3592 domain-containing protein [Ferrimonas balearica]MBY5920781.1 DUF3592 domain-containing protein [Ferrimonas balearica]MBY5996534.1 DUF3592 domain-containing protein [Ferrimonas balearica]